MNLYFPSIKYVTHAIISQIALEFIVITYSLYKLLSMINSENKIRSVLYAQ